MFILGNLSLFNNLRTVLITIAVIIVVGLILLALIKSPNGKFFVSLFLVIALLVGGTISAIYSAGYLNTYYSSRGGIIGSLNGIGNPNKAIVTDCQFSFENCELSADGEPGVYSAIFDSDKTFNIDNNKSYVVTVNDTLCNYNSVSYDHINCDYKYTFIGLQDEELLTDTLEIKIALYKSHTTIILSTRGGENAVKKWNYYFNMNNFKLQVKQVPTVIFEDTIDLSDFAYVNIYANNNLVSKVLTRKGSAYTLPALDAFDIDGYLVKGYLINGEDFTASSLTVSRTIDITIKTAKANTVTLLDTDGALLKKIKLEEGETLKPEDLPTKSVLTDKNILRWNCSDGSIITRNLMVVYPGEGQSGDISSYEYITVTTASGDVDYDELPITTNITLTAVYGESTGPSTGEIEPSNPPKPGTIG